MEFIDSLISKDIFSVYLSGKAVQIAGVMSQKGKRNLPEVVYTESLPFPDDYFENGLILKPKPVAKRILDRVQRIEAKNCIFSLPSEQTFEFFFHAEEKDIKDINEIIVEKIKENVPIPANEVNYKYIFSKYKKNRIVSVSVIASEVVEGYYEFLKLCGLNPVAIEPEYCSLLRNMYIKAGQSKGCIVVNIDPEKLEWFGLVEDNLVDSNILFRKEQKVRPLKEVLRFDLERSILNFNTYKRLTEKDISQIYVSNKTKKISDDILEALEDVSQKFDIPIKIIDRFKLVPEVKRNSPEDFKICLGAALYLFEPNSFTMNFMEKN